MIVGIENVLFRRGHESITKEKHLTFTIKRFTDGKSILNVRHGILPKNHGNKRKVLLPFENDSIDYTNVQRSTNRIKGRLMDLTLCNDFQWFITLTFDNEVLDRLNDDETRLAWQRWENNAKHKFPEMTYICVSEYHKKGGLHFHLLVGNINESDLGLVPAMFHNLETDEYIQIKEWSKVKNDLVPVYNVSAWNYGFSTCTKILSKDACKNYVLKYVVKGTPDPRFFNKHRYSCSKNLIKPDVYTYTDYCEEFNPEEVFELYEVDPVFYSRQKGIYKYEFKGDVYESIAQ